jgi:RbsD / FucU transport protein family
MDKRKRRQARQNWENNLNGELPLLGHRNWIVVADSAYPAHSNPGIQTMIASGDPLDVIERVIACLTMHWHIKTSAYKDLELDYVSEEDAPGVTRYRRRLAAILKHAELRCLPHEQIIAKLDHRARIFRVLIIKTELMIPYTSVFLELDCGYWTEDAEKRLRREMGKRKRGN